MHGRRSVAALRVQAHQRAVGGLVQRVEVQPSLGVGDGLVELAGGRAGLDESGARRGHHPAQPLGLPRLPVIEVGAVAEAEAGQQVAAPQGGRLRHLLDVVGRRAGEERPDVDRRRRRRRRAPPRPG